VADRIDRMRLIEFLVGKQHRRALHRLSPQHLIECLQAAFAARPHQARGPAMHADGNALLAVGSGTEQKLLACMGDEHEVHGLVRDAPDRGQQREPVTVGRARVDGDHAGLADDEAGVAGPAQVLGIDLARRALQHVDARGDLDRACAQIARRGRCGTGAEQRRAGQGDQGHEQASASGNDQHGERRPRRW
jgi:hypothetical protein